MIHKTINNDLIKLREEIKKDNKKIKIDEIVKHYFEKRKSSNCLTVRQIINICVKVSYIIVNFVAFFGTDRILDGEFYGYGGRWVSWTKHNNSMAYDYMGARDFPKPGN